ncbi:hypothetical protein [Sphingomonas sp. Leaf20]|uniref:hypothetical protein n=1 Tax=Sphingomonas sp. Leaf20 TaxID=1735685 RepID=UPI0007145525|nr:hypothetical protein [Sphingomonas sp. Leaf20]KQM71684.1 hypothetical protein ASE72_09180 [Sphingomonas sp. Leaf20]
MTILFVAAALIAVSPPASQIVVQAASATQQTAPSMTTSATSAETLLKALLKGAAPGGKIDYSAMTPEVAQIVRDHPEGGEMIIKLGTPQTVTYLGAPPGGHLFRITFATAKIDFFMAVNGAGKISSMYYHPSVDMPS